MASWRWSLSSSFFLFVYRTARLRRFLKNPTPRRCFIGISFHLLCIHFLLRWVCLSRPVFLFFFQTRALTRALSLREGDRTFQRRKVLFPLPKIRHRCNSKLSKWCTTATLVCFVEGVGGGTEELQASQKWIIIIAQCHMNYIHTKWVRTDWRSVTILWQWGHSI